MIERLADYAHEAWAGWMRYLFSKSVKNADGSVTIPAELVSRWERQLNTNYYDLPKSEKKSDRQQARKIVALVGDELIRCGKHGGAHLMATGVVEVETAVTEQG